MKIGELAKATGLTTKTIRFYEAEGLLPAPARTLAGYRVYRVDDVERLDFIRKAKRIGMTLGEINGILQLHDSSEPTCVHVSSLLDEKLAQVDRALEDLQQVRKEIAEIREEAGALVDCRPLGGSICGIIEGSNVAVGGQSLTWIGSKRIGK
ncbi:MAG: heavy metal-responsive transcriptional regulator [Chloroflexi bacterium]|nr:heavy metal-responsive transcriptional regulator [Chloroflexota bacterium]